MSETETDPVALAETRAARLAMIMEGYEVYDAPDSSVPHAAGVEYIGPYTLAGDHRIPRKHPRYVLVTQCDDKGNYRVHLANDLALLDQLAAHVVRDGELIACYFDLDQLAGEEELPLTVQHGGEEWMVHGREYVNSEPTDRWVLKKSPRDRRKITYDWAVAHPADCDLGDWADERMPVRYGVAKVVVSVAFNTVPSP